MNYLIIYDNTLPKSDIIVDVIGNRKFADVVVKKKTLGDHFNSSIKSILGENSLVITVSYAYEFNDILEKMEAQNCKDMKILHYFSNYVITDEYKAGLTLKKLSYVDSRLVIEYKRKPVGIMFSTVKEYITFLNTLIESEGKTGINILKGMEPVTEIEGIINIGLIENFIQCIAGNFDSRYFNSLQGDEYTIVKTSTNKEKIKAEYSFYHLLPEDMQFWFVEPFNYKESLEQASYTMERLHMTDIAIKWVQGSIDEEELGLILDKYFYFFNHRHSRRITNEEYKRIANQLYIEKVLSRIEELKRLPQFENMKKLLSLNMGQTIEDIVNRYLQLKEKVEKKIKQESISVIGHGDPCFANTMYNKSTRTLKFIDPKGALSEEELWTNPYYDIAKLSHSICGRYDFFNNELFEIKLNGKFETELIIDFDNTVYINLFRKKVEENGYNYWLVRLYEASLFISMLPLHIDNPHKVFGFMLNANNILNEVEKNV